MSLIFGIVHSLQGTCERSRKSGLFGGFLDINSLSPCAHPHMSMRQSDVTALNHQLRPLLCSTPACVLDGRSLLFLRTETGDILWKGAKDTMCCQTVKAACLSVKQQEICQ